MTKIETYYIKETFDRCPFCLSFPTIAYRHGEYEAYCDCHNFVLICKDWVDLFVEWNLGVRKEKNDNDLPPSDK